MKSNFNITAKNSPPGRGIGDVYIGEIIPLLGGVARSAGVVVMRKRRTYYSLPYNPNLRERAKELRKAGNLCEVLLWQQLNKNHFKPCDFDRQKIIGNYIVDFYCANFGVVIEIDGSSHDKKFEYDYERNEFLESLGLTVIHIGAQDVLHNLDGVIAMLKNHPALRAPLPGGE